MTDITGIETDESFAEHLKNLFESREDKSIDEELEMHTKERRIRLYYACTVLMKRGDDRLFQWIASKRSGRYYLDVKYHGQTECPAH